MWYATSPDPNLQLCHWVMPWVGARGQMYNKSDLSIWKIVVEIYALRCCYHMGKDQRAGLFVYFVHMSSCWYFFFLIFFFLKTELIQPYFQEKHHKFVVWQCCQ